MPDIIDRDTWEQRLARAVGKKFRGQLDELISLLGDPPDPNNIPPAFWENGGKEIRGVIEPILAELFIKQVETLVLEINIGVEWGLVNQWAIDWVSSYTFDLVRGMTQTSQAALQKAIEAFYRDGLSKEQLISLIEPLFGPVRAEMIAVTEVTRAAVEGERAMVQWIEQNNPSIRLIPVWQTANDDIVCPICAPRHNKIIEDGIFPPAHPRCRCWVTRETTVME